MSPSESDLFRWRSNGEIPQPPGCSVFGVGDHFRARVGDQGPQAIVELFFDLELQRVIGRVAGVLIDALQLTAVLRIGQQSLRERRRAGRHLLNPALIGYRHAVQARIAGLKFVVELLAVWFDSEGLRTFSGAMREISRVPLVPT